MQKTKLAGLLVIAVALTLMGTSLAYAQSTTPDTSGIPTISSGVGKWFIGVLWASVGFAVAKSKGEQFDALNFGSTILIGIVLSVLTTVGNVDPNVALGIVGILTPILDKLLGKKSNTASTPL